MCNRFRLLWVTTLLGLLIAAQPSTFAADKQQRKAKESEAKRLTTLGRNAEKQGRLLEARQQYLASEQVLFNEDAEKGLERIAEAADKQVKTLMADAEKAYVAENFAKAAQLLETAAALHPGNLAIGCNLALTRYQQGNHDDALTLLDQCVGALQDREPRRQLAELHTALTTGDRLSVVAPGDRQQVARLNDAMLQKRDNDPHADDDEADAPSPPAAGLCAQMRQLQAGLLKNPAMLFNLANCAESEGRLSDAIRLLTEYSQAAPTAADSEEVVERLVVLKSLSALPDPSGTLVRTLYASAGKHVESRGYDLAIADYLKAAEAIPEFSESQRRVASLLEAQGQVGRARTIWQQVILADPNDESRGQTQLIVDGLDAEAAEYNELVGAARLLLQDLIGRSLLEGERVGRIYAASRLQLANEKIRSAALLQPLAAEGNMLQAFTCAQMNDFRCVRASFDAQRSLTLPVSFYAAVFYKGVDPENREKTPRTYGKFEFEKGMLRFAEISTVNPKKQTAQLPASLAGEDRLGRLGSATGLRTPGFQGFTVAASAIKHLETQNGLLYLEVDDRNIKHRKMLIEPLSLVITVPPKGPGSRRYMNNYLNIAETYGGVEKVKLGKESTTAGEKLKMVYNIATIGMDVTSLMFGNFYSIIEIAQGVNTLSRKIALNQRQIQRLATERRHAIGGIAFKAIPTEPARLTFRKDLK
ncbi:MAG: tetratricopeptide repeat protein [Acidobacteriota bacterium]